MTVPVLQGKAAVLLDRVLAVRAATAARQAAARLRQRLASLDATVAAFSGAEALFLACRALDEDGHLEAPDLDRLTAAKQAFGSAQNNGDDIDQAALALMGALNAARDALRAAVEKWWSAWAPDQVRDAGVEAIDLLEPGEQDRARGFAENLRRAADGVPKTPGDVSSFRYELDALAELVSGSNVADLPKRVGDLLRAIGRQQLRLSDLVSEDLEALNNLGYAEKLSIRWGVLQR